MIRKILIYFFIFYFLTLLQTSFLVHFRSFNLVLILVIFLSLLEEPELKDGILAAIFGGFFLDIFSEKFIGFHILVLFCLALFLKFVFKKYVRIPTLKRISK